MLKGWQWWVLTLAALIAVALVSVNMFLFADNRQTQAQINAQAQFVQQTVQLDQLYREIVRTLAQLSVQGADDQLRGLLTKHGFTVNVAPPATAASDAGAAANNAAKAKR